MLKEKFLYWYWGCPVNAPTISENALAGEAGPQRGTLSGAVLQGTGQMMLFSCLKKYVRLHLLGGRRSAQHPPASWRAWPSSATWPCAGACPTTLTSWSGSTPLPPPTPRLPRHGAACWRAADFYRQHRHQLKKVEELSGLPVEWSDHASAIQICSGLLEQDVLPDVLDHLVGWTKEMPGVSRPASPHLRHAKGLSICRNIFYVSIKYIRKNYFRCINLKNNINLQKTSEMWSNTPKYITLSFIFCTGLQTGQLWKKHSSPWAFMI